jgi:hypothetical protein
MLFTRFLASEDSDNVSGHPHSKRHVALGDYVDGPGGNGTLYYPTVGTLLSGLYL